MKSYINIILYKILIFTFVIDLNNKFNNNNNNNNDDDDNILRLEDVLILQICLLVQNQSIPVA